MGWIQKCDIDNEPLPIPTQIVSNEEVEPADQTDEQRHVENRIIETRTSRARGLELHGGNFSRARVEGRSVSRDERSLRELF